MLLLLFPPAIRQGSRRMLPPFISPAIRQGSRRMLPLLFPPAIQQGSRRMLLPLFPPAIQQGNRQFFPPYFPLVLYLICLHFRYLVFQVGLRCTFKKSPYPPPTLPVRCRRQTFHTFRQGCRFLGLPKVRLLGVTMIHPFVLILCWFHNTIILSSN